jgi:hypothetical protein
MGDEIVRVDGKRIRRVLTISVIGALLLSAVLWPLYAHFRDAMPTANTHLTPERINELRFQLQLTFVGIFAGMGAPFFMLILSGVRALRYGMLPLPGAFVFRDTKILRGFDVLWRGYASIAIGVSGTLAALFGCWWTVNFLGR